MQTIQNIKDYCTSCDIQEFPAQNLTDDQITIQRDKIKRYYKDITLKRLLEIYAEYNGLDQLTPQERIDKGYVIDILNLSKEL